MRTLFICLPLLAWADAGNSQRSGLLLGLRSGDRSPLVSDTTTIPYRTLWLAPANGQIGLVAELSTLVVPRNDGFWRLDIERTCGITEATMEMGGPFVDTFDEPVWRRLGSPRSFAPSDGSLDCDEARRQVRAIHADTADEALYAEPCNTRDITITHASPALASYDTHSAHTEFCSPGRYVSSTFLSVVDTLRRAVSLLQALAPSREAAVRQRWDAARTDCTFEDGPDENWGIVRGVGEWVTDFSSSGPTACRGAGMAEFDIRERIPAAIARSEPAEWLPRLRRLVTGLDDFFVSPAGDLIFVRTGDQLSAYAVEGGTPGGPLFRHTLRPGERVVLAEWAVGSHVTRWSAELSRLAR